MKTGSDVIICNKFKSCILSKVLGHADTVQMTLFFLLTVVLWAYKRKHVGLLGTETFAEE